MIVKLLAEHHLEFLSLKGGCRGSSESTLVKMSNCWKSHAAAQFFNFLMKVVHTLCIDWLGSVDDYTCFDCQYDHEVKDQGQINIASGCNVNLII